MPECTVYLRSGNPPRVATFTEENSGNLKTGDKARLYFAGKTHYVEVQTAGVSGPVANRDNVIFSDGILGETRAGSYSRVSAARYSLHKALGTRKAKVSLGATILTIASAAGASINSAQTATCSGFHCVKEFSWILIGIAAGSAIFSWAKEI